MFKFNLKNKKNVYLAKPWLSGGFTLIEMLVAVSIFSMAILVFMTVLSNGITDTNYAKNKTIAAFLATEGIEYIRNMRDTYVNYDSAPDVGWQNFKTKMAVCTPASGGCNFDDLLPSFDLNELESMNIYMCNVAKNCSLYYSSSTGRYSYNHLVGDGVDSGFTRVITVDQIGDEVKISSTVSWTNSSINYNVSFSDNLLKWKE